MSPRETFLQISTLALTAAKAIPPKLRIEKAVEFSDYKLPGGWVIVLDGHIRHKRLYCGTWENAIRKVYPL